MEIDILKQVLKEILDEQKTNSDMLITVRTQINELKDVLEKYVRLDASEKKPIQDSNLVSKLEDINSGLKQLQSGYRVDKRVLLFPEHNAREYYSVILRWLLYGLIATYAYLLLSGFIQRLQG